MQIKNCWEELQPKTVGALRDDKLFGYVLKRPVYPIGLMVTQLGNSSKNGLLFDWPNKQPNDSVVYVSFGSGAIVSHEQMIGRAICVIFLILKNVYFVIIRWLLQF